MVEPTADAGRLDLGAMRRACGFCSLKELCWPMGLELSELKRLQSVVGRSDTLPAGSFLFRDRDPFTALYAVRSGCIKSFSVDAGGRESVRGFHLRGELLGFDAIHPDHHRCSAVVLEDSSVCVIPYQDLVRLNQEFPGLQNQILRLLSREFARQRMFAGDAVQRIAIFLLDVRDRLERSEAIGCEFRLPMSREDISNYLGITAETLSRLLTKLQRKGLIEIDRRKILVLDPARLDLIAQGVE
jgi:CRP/FNR family transcriptional regulator